MREMIHYLGVRFCGETNRALSEYRLLSGLSQRPMPKLDFHTTIVYSRTPFIFTVGKMPHNPIGVCNNVAELYGTSIVLPYTSPFLAAIYSIVVSNGATSDYKIYKPHITIAEDCNEEQLSLVNEKQNIPIVVNEIFYKEYR